MCGIAGIYSLKKSQHELEQAGKKMLDLLRNRGPDNQSIWLAESLVLAHTRLAIIAPSTGKQPIHSADGRYTLIYNGELYNYRELRHELKNFWDFKTQSDTEVILAAYVTYGQQALKKFDGMFAFFIWDSLQKVGFAARDLMGIKPFCYHYNAQQEFIFASEPKAILAVCQNLGLNHKYIWDFWASPAFTDNHNMPFAEIFNLPPGHMLTISAQGLELSCWQDYLTNIQHVQESSALFNQLDTTLVHACKSVLQADTPITSYLSGGLDSSLVTALAAQFSPEFKESYSIQFTGQNQYNYQESLIVKDDDYPYAQELADFAKIRLNPVSVNQHELMAAFPLLGAINYQIPAWEQEFTHFFLAKETSKKYKVTLVGDVSDETHYGYHYLLDEQMIASPRAIIDRFANAPLALSPQACQALYEQRTEELLTAAKKAGYHWQSKQDCYLATSYLIIKFWLPRLLLNADIYPMHFGLEARVPFANTALMQLASAISPELAMKNNIEKYCLKKIAHNKIPDSIIQRLKSSLPKDQSIGVCYQDEFKKIAQDPITEGLISNYLDWHQVKQISLKTAPLNEKERGILFKIISFYYWHNYYFSESPLITKDITRTWPFL